jgi:hypothetical protein
MAVANSTIQLIIPGIDKLIADSFTTAIAANATIQAIQTNIQNAGSISDIQNALGLLVAEVAFLPNKEPLPHFATWSNINNDPRGTIYNSEMREVETILPDTNSEMWSTWTGNNYTNGNIGSNGWTSYWMGSTSFYQADTHWYYRISKGRANSAVAMNPDGMDANMPYWGVIIGNTGKRQKISLYNNNNNLRVYPRGVQNGYLDQISLSSTTYATNWFGGTTYGSVGYNERTGTVVVIEAKDGSNNYRLHRWINTGEGRSLNQSNYKAGMLHRFFSEARNGLTTNGTASYNSYDFQWQANSSQNYTESRYRMRVIVGDNGIIGMQRFVPSNITHYATFTPSSGVLTTSYNTISNTTSYGMEQGNKYGARHMITWDNNWVAAYNVYYYYGSGMNVFFLDTRDPRNYFVGQYADTSNGCSLIPFNKNKFVWTYHVSNADGTSGMRITIIDLEGPSKTGRTMNTTISNGANIDLSKNIMNGIFDTKYTSTNYPLLLPVQRWPRAI